MISCTQNGIKMQSFYLLILYSGIPTSEFLPGSVHHQAGTRVPVYFSQAYNEHMNLYAMQ